MNLIRAVINWFRFRRKGKKVSNYGFNSSLLTNETKKVVEKINKRIQNFGEKELITENN
jgi:hypothetical protein